MNSEQPVPINVIPRPAEMKMLGGTFRLPTTGSIRVDARSPEAKPAAEVLQRRINPARKVSTTQNPPADQDVRFVPASRDMGLEGYGLNIDSAGVTIEASSPAGWFYGVQTLLHLLPPVPVPAETGFDLPCVRIVDWPRFKWRGLMLDVVRHIMPVDGILRLLDNMAAHKLNTFHWHLTDDQGWRIESKKYPKLSEISAFRRGADGALTFSDAKEELPHLGKYGGFYSHDDIRKVVAHAAALHVRVVPEIEMPGHAVAVLAAYPELSCTGGPFETGVRMGIYKDVYCAGNDAVFDFLQGVLDEVIPLFPGEYLHIGGDECLKDRWQVCPRCQARIKKERLKDEHELQSYFIRRMGKFIASRGKWLIGWDEILEGGLADNAAVMSWRGVKGGIAAAHAGHDVVMSPNSHCYLDYKQAPDGEPLAIGSGFIALEKTYAYEPIPPELTPDQAKYILGVQGNVWTEYMPDMRHVEYMIWPRGAAIAEIAWSPAAGRDLSDFRRRVRANEARLKASGSSYRPEMS